MPLVVDICRISDDGEVLEGELPASDLDLGLGNRANALGALCYKLTISLVSGELLVRGKLSMALKARCSRCAELFEFTVQDDDFARALGLDKTAEYVDLTADIREAIILAFPSHPICRSECKGLCVRCGTNLNDGACDCRPPADNRWNALDSLKRKE